MKAFAMIHADSAIVVVDKAAGVLTVPTQRREKNTLVDLVARHLGLSAHPRARLHVVHRLDRDTSGDIVFARTAEAARVLIGRWRSAHERRYACLVHGSVPRERGEIRSHLVTDKNLDRRSAQDGRGELAVTRYTVTDRLRDASLLDVELDTGRRNQIRVHMAELGHPILGDTRYARRMPPHPLWPTSRLALHARMLTLVHPETGAVQTFESPLPEVFVAFLEGARKGDGQRRSRW